MITEKRTANAIGGKTARACESCLKRRASWFCPADDAFLCHACDSSVHAANELAGRHGRVRLGTASTAGRRPDDCHAPSPAWHHGFTRKARTPRHGRQRAKASPSSSAHEKAAHMARMMMPLVPEMSGDEGSTEENEENMVFSVPTFDPFEVELNDDNKNGLNDDEKFNISLIGFDGECPEGWGSLPGFDDDDLAEFAADVESLLEQDPADDQMYAALPLLTADSGGRESVSDRPFEKNPEGPTLGVAIKVEKEESTVDCDHEFEWSVDVASEMFNFGVNYGSSDHAHGSVEEFEEKVVVAAKMEDGIEGDYDNDNNNGQANCKRRRIFLRLNYEEVINAWAGPSPWTAGRRPEFDPDHDGWLNCMGVVSPTGTRHQEGDMMGVRSGHVDGGDAGREARVSRYREKRRTRFFSKKIRYEVRKLNAEKRPRLKGRFVKRTSLAPPVVGVGPTFSLS